MGDDGVDPTELAGVAEAETESVHAWALDDEDEIETRRLTPRRITDAALAGCLVLIAARRGGAAVIRGASQIEPAPLPVVAAPPPPPAPSTAAPTTTTVRAQPAPPGPWITPTKPVTVTVQAPPKTIDATVQAPPPAGITVEQLAAYDRQFVANPAGARMGGLGSAGDNPAGAPGLRDAPAGRVAAMGGPAAHRPHHPTE